MSDFAWFGYPALESSILAWALVPSSTPATSSPWTSYGTARGISSSGILRRTPTGNSAISSTRRCCRSCKNWPTTSLPATRVSSSGISSGRTIRACSWWRWEARTAPTATSTSPSIWCRRKVRRKSCRPKDRGNPYRRRQDHRGSGRDADLLSWKNDGHRPIPHRRQRPDQRITVQVGGLSPCSRDRRRGCHQRLPRPMLPSSCFSLFRRSRGHIGIGLCR